MSKSDQHAKQTYDEMGEKYQEAYGDNPNQINFIRESLEKLQSSGSRTVLDIGSGTGRPTCSMVAAAGYRIHGIDVSKEMVRIARKQVTGATFELTSMLEYQPATKFDAAFSIFSTFDLEPEEMEKVVPKWGDWIKPDGWLFVGTIAGEDWPAEGVEFDEDRGIAKPKHMGKTVDTTNYTKAGWAKLLEKGGFEVVECDVRPYQPPEEYGSSREPHYYITCRRRAD